MKARYVTLGKPTLLTIKNIVNYFVCVGPAEYFKVPI